MVTQQLPLSFSFSEPLSFENFLINGNQELINQCHKLIDSSDCQSLFIWGSSGAGKSHLCQALCHAAENLQAEVVYVPLGEPGLVPEMLEQLEHYPIVILEDIHTVLGQSVWDEAIFHLFNRIREANGRLLLTSNKAPNSLQGILPDLQSRLSWGLVYQLESLNDDDKVLALKDRAAERGLKLSAEAAQYLMSRMPRDSKALFSVLEQLDKESLQHQRALTVPFIKKVLDL